LLQDPYYKKIGPPCDHLPMLNPYYQKLGRRRKEFRLLSGHGLQGRRDEAGRPEEFASASKGGGAVVLLCELVT
jgi:hypothetical protein